MIPIQHQPFRPYPKYNPWQSFCYFGRELLAAFAATFDCHPTYPESHEPWPCGVTSFPPPLLELRDLLLPMNLIYPLPMGRYWLVQTVEPPPSPAVSPHCIFCILNGYHECIF